MQQRRAGMELGQGDSRLKEVLAGILTGRVVGKRVGKTDSTESIFKLSLRTSVN